MNTFLLGILIIGGTGLTVCGTLYVLFKFLDNQRSHKWDFIINRAESSISDEYDLRPPQQDLIRQDVIPKHNNVSPRLGDWF